MITAPSIDLLWKASLKYLFENGTQYAMRGGDAIRLTDPVILNLTNPTNIVLQCEDRKHDPFLTLFEPLWVLSGYPLIDFLAQFVPRVVEFSDDGKAWRGAYGPRMRSHFGRDQIQAAIDLLRKDPFSNHAVIGIWDPALDGLGVKSKDHPCNDMIMFSTTIVESRGAKEKCVLDMTVINRSNDIVWGLFPNNLTTFSILQQYVSDKVGIPVGHYRHISNNLHIYNGVPNFQKYVDIAGSTKAYVSKTLRINAAEAAWDDDLSMLFKSWEDRRDDDWNDVLDLKFNTLFFKETVMPMLYLFFRRREALRMGNTEKAKRLIEDARQMRFYDSQEIQDF